MWNYNHWTGTTGRRPRSAEPPENRFLLYFWVLREHFWALMKLNLFVLLTSLPIVTIAPSVAAMNRIVFKMIEDKPQLLWQEYWHVFRKELKPALFAGIPLTIVSAALILIGGFFRNIDVSGGQSLLALIGLAVVFVIGSYVFAMLPYLELSIWQCYKNAVIMLLLCFWRNLLTVLLVMTLAAVFILGHPLTTPVLIFFAVPIFGYLIAFQVYAPLHKYLVDKHKEL